ncbi:MAG: tRNA (N6-isopentenyl adenosine(37)-C2)-methylthiotransferase MiaB [Clostridia bacterium]
MNYFIKTYGCQMNIHESEKVAKILEDLGYISTNDIELADIIAFNTCCIRETAESKIKGHIGELKRLKQLNPKLIIVIFGCMTQQTSVASLVAKRFSYVDIVIGTTNLHLLKDKILAIKPKKQIIDVDECSAHPELNSSRTSYPNAWVNIIYGCNNFCSYCIVPYVRGREHSRNKLDIINEVKQLIDEGYKEITLLGQNVNSYGNDLQDGSNFADLLAEIATLDGHFRLRFMTSHPKDLSQKVIDTIAKYPKICHSVHLPVQSGSDEVLRKMNRRYTRQHYIDLVNSIKSTISNVGLSSDIMVGFPGETEQDFLDTLDLVRQVRLTSCFCFVYSRRKGTLANDMVQVPQAIKTDRIKRLIETQNQITKEISKTYEGNTYEVLIEDTNTRFVDTYCGRTDCGKLVNVKSKVNLIGEFIKVKIKKSQSATLWGEIL